MAEAGGFCGILAVTGLSTFCNSNHTGTKSSNRQAGCCPASFCGGDHAEDDFDRAERLDREAAAAKARQQTQMEATPAMTTSPAPVKERDGGDRLEPPLVKEGRGSGVAGFEERKGEDGARGGLAGSPVVAGLEGSAGGEGLTREALEARKAGAA